MSARAIATQRLINQGLVKPTLRTATAVVARLGAVQAQDYAASRWGRGIAQRSVGLTDTEIERERERERRLRSSGRDDNKSCPELIAVIARNRRCR